MTKKKWLIALAAGAGAAAVTYKLLSKDIPEGATAVQPFDIDRYMGLWYEVARMPSMIEQNLNQLTEDYSFDANGNLQVITKAYNTQKGEWKTLTGKMKFNGSPVTGMLKVSYFGPFYLAYNVLDIDADYRYALVSGSGLDYLWILSRETTIPDHIRIQFLNTAKGIGFSIHKLEWM